MVRATRGREKETERWIEILNFAWNEEDTARVLKRDALSDSSGSLPWRAGSFLYKGETTHA